MTALAVDAVPGIRIDDVRVGERARKDYGDLTSLRESIAEHGLLQPIVLLPDNSLLCGGRRLKACQELGWASIPYVRSSTQTDAISRLKAERDENTCRKDMTYSELVALAKAITAMKQPEVEQRIREGSARGGRGGRSGTNVPDLESDQKASQRVRKEVAEAVGLSEGVYTRAKRVVEVAEDESAPEEVRVVAVEAREQMDAGSLSVGAAHNRVKEAINAAAEPSGDTSRRLFTAAERVEQIRALADTGRTSAQIGDELGIGEYRVRDLARKGGIEITADKLLSRTHRVRVDRDHIVSHLVTTLEGLVDGLDNIDIEALDEARIQDWADSLTKTTRALNRFVKQIKEKTQ